MKPNAVLVRYAEVFLKGGRRPWFEARLREAIDRQVSAAGPFRVREMHACMAVAHRDSKGWDLPDIEVGDALNAAIGRCFGVVSWSPARIVAREISRIEAEVAAIADEDVAGAETFKVESSRSDKDFPLDSMELNRRLGGVVWERTRVKVRMKDPTVTVSCQILPKVAALFVETRPGPGGLPVGSSGRVLLLLSGGIDSPAAGWLAMRRGCEIDAVHFDAAPYTGPESRAKVEDLARLLAAHERSMRLHVVPFGALQADLRDGAPGRLLVLLYRRMMVRIASAIAAERGALALVTGENLGQVASQTLENLAVIEDATAMPILRPLVTYDKMETVALARRIGTYETSIRPGEDCCSLFVPDHPETAGRVARLREVESRFDVEAMVAAALKGVEALDLP
ncbi:MAG: tRNA 4-thiouridine(8) synthase ThiI [Deltaproteobacteria bacterium]|nr:tRNA 4-thiouridine(8) synthase ThiI [Deltaproteobacteria bacterium]